MYINKQQKSTNLTSLGKIFELLGVRPFVILTRMNSRQTICTSIILVCPKWMTLKTSQTFSLEEVFSSKKHPNLGRISKQQIKKQRTLLFKVYILLLKKRGQRPSHQSIPSHSLTAQASQTSSFKLSSNFEKSCSKTKISSGAWPRFLWFCYIFSSHMVLRKIGSNIANHPSSCQSKRCSIFHSSHTHTSSSWRCPSSTGWFVEEKNTVKVKDME